MLASPYFGQSHSIRVGGTYHKQITTPEDGWETFVSDEEHCLLFKDPLFCFYFRTFTRLYHQLSLLKPVLIQERVAHDPWKLLVAVTLLNKTAGKIAIPVFWSIIEQYPTPLLLSEANASELTSMIQPLGLQAIRAKRLIELSAVYMQEPPSHDRYYPSRAYHTTSGPSSPVSTPPSSPSKRKRYPPTPISHLPGTGPYALDSYRIFCANPSDKDAWKEVMPTDKELIRFLKWKWAFQERKRWVPGLGVVSNADVDDLERLVDDLTKSRIAQ